MARAARAGLGWLWRLFAGVVLTCLDCVWLGTVTRACSWWVYDTYRQVRTGIPERLYGLDLIVGLYGSGKTALMVYELEQHRAARGDKVQIWTNFGWAGEDGPIRGWRHMLEALDETLPQVFAWDELGSSLSQHDFGKDFPKDLFRFVTQMRKGPGVKVYCTVQRFSNASVDLRRLAKYIIEVRGYLRARWIFAAAYDGYENYNDGLPRLAPVGTRDLRVKAWQKSFIFNDYLRSRYDSYRIIPALMEFSDAEMAARAAEDEAARVNYQALQTDRRTGAPSALAPAPGRNGRSVRVA